MKAFARTDAGSMQVELMTVPIPTVAQDEVLVSIVNFVPKTGQFSY